MGTRPPNPTDRRVQRTRRALREALIALLLERGWNDTSIEQICERADVGRSTFYTHFADKEELLVGGFDDLRKLLRAPLPRAREAAPPLAFARGLIEHAHEHKRLFRALIGKRSGEVVLRRFRELVVDLVREDLAERHAPGAEREAAIRFLAGGLLELLTWSLESRTGLGPDEVERLFRRMAGPVVGALGR